MDMRSVLLYGCAVVVIVSGIKRLATLATQDGEEMPPPLALLRSWRRPVTIPGQQSLRFVRMDIARS